MSAKFFDDVAPATPVVQAHLAKLSALARTTEAYRGLPDLETRFRVAPITEKVRVRENPERFRSSAAAGAQHGFLTSGTSGMPMFVVRTKEEFASNAAAIVDRLAPQFQAGRSLRILSLVSHDGTAIGRLVEEIGDQMDAMVVRCFPYAGATLDLDKIITRATTSAANVIIGTPGVIQHLESALRSRGCFDQFAAQITNIVMLGEPTTIAMQNKLARSWRCLARVGTYGSTETGTIGVGCMRGNLHFVDDRYIAEVRNDDRIAPLAAGAAGELIITPLHGEATVLIRYATGDTVDVFRCACPLTSPAFRVLGREGDFVNHADGRRLDPEQVEEMVFAQQGVHDYVLKVDAEKTIREIHIETSDVLSDLQISILAADLGARVEIVDELPIAARMGGINKSWERSRVRRLPRSVTS